MDFISSWDEYADALKQHQAIIAEYPNLEDARPILAKLVEDLRSVYKVWNPSPDADPLDMVLQRLFVHKTATKDGVQLCQF